ncbi:hypothetical protein IAT40_001566 [Kwoniella sp. CBS 6097]
MTATSQRSVALSGHIIDQPSIPHAILAFTDERDSSATPETYECWVGKEPFEVESARTTVLMKADGTVSLQCHCTHDRLEDDKGRTVDFAPNHDMEDVVGHSCVELHWKHSHTEAPPDVTLSITDKRQASSVSREYYQIGNHFSNGSRYTSVDDDGTVYITDLTKRCPETHSRMIHSLRPYENTSVIVDDVLIEAEWSDPATELAQKARPKKNDRTGRGTLQSDGQSGFSRDRHETEEASQNDDATGPMEKATDEAASGTKVNFPQDRHICTTQAMLLVPIAGSMEHFDPRITVTLETPFLGHEQDGTVSRNVNAKRRMSLLEAGEEDEGYADVEEEECSSKRTKV